MVVLETKFVMRIVKPSDCREQPGEEFRLELTAAQVEPSFMKPGYEVA